MVYKIWNEEILVDCEMWTRLFIVDWSEKCDNEWCETNSFLLWTSHGTK